MTGFLNYSSCATRLGVESNISPLVSYVNCSDKSYPQSYPHNSSTIATVYGVIHRLIHRKDIEGHRLRPHAKIKISSPSANGQKLQALSCRQLAPMKIQCSEWNRFLVRQWGQLRLIHEYLHYFLKVASKFILHGEKGEE